VDLIDFTPSIAADSPPVQAALNRGRIGLPRTRWRNRSGVCRQLAQPPGRADQPFGRLSSAGGIFLRGPIGRSEA